MTLDDSVRAWRLLPSAGRGQRDGRLSGGGDLPDGLLPMARALRTVRGGRPAPRRHQAQRGRLATLGPHTERLIVGTALAWPTLGGRPPGRPPGRAGLGLGPPEHPTALLAPGRLGHPAPAAGGPGDAQCDRGAAHRGPRALRRARSGRQHVAAEQPGELVCVDTFYLGKLKGVGKVWQVTACDAACSYGMARILPGLTAKACAAFLRDVLRPQQGRLRPGLPGPGDPDTRTKPRHAWTNGFVERLQGTLLQEHWRIQFRRRYFTSRRQLQQSLEAFLRFYNTQRPTRATACGPKPGDALLGCAGGNELTSWCTLEICR